MTDPAGGYSIELDPGTYYVVFEGTPLAYEWQWYNEKTHGDRDIVSVGSEPVHGIDATLLSFGRIEGTVRDEGSGDPVGDARVCAWNVDDREAGHCTRTDENGTYGIGGLPPGEYMIEFWGWSTNHLWQYYDHAEYAEADPVFVHLGDVLTGIDSDLPAGAGVEGVVTRASSGEPFTSLWIEIRPLNEETFWGAGLESDGTFRAVGLPPGEYKIEFVPYNTEWQTQFWDHTTSWEEAETVTLESGIITNGIRADIVRNLTIPTPLVSPVVSAIVGQSGPTTLSPSSSPPSSSPPQRRLCRKGYRLKRAGNRFRCVRKHRRHNLRSSNKHRR
jgi:hypothetical protein